MTRALALAPLLFAACTDVDYGPEVSDPTTPVAIDVLRVDGAPGIVATGGAQAVTIASIASVGWSGEATAGFSVEPFDLNGWPNTTRPEYWVRAHAAGTGSFLIRTNFGIAAGNVESAPVATVEVRPHGYALAGSAFAIFTIDGSLRDVQAVLRDDRGRRLVDATLVVADELAPGAAAEWDGLTLGAATGRHTISVAADSFAARTFAIDVRAFDRIDRIETEQLADRTCRHAYAGDVEVVTARAVASAPLPGAANCSARSVQ